MSSHIDFGPREVIEDGQSRYAVLDRPDCTVIGQVWGSQTRGWDWSTRQRTDHLAKTRRQAAQNLIIHHVLGHTDAIGVDAPSVRDDIARSPEVLAIAKAKVEVVSVGARVRKVVWP